MQAAMEESMVCPLDTYTLGQLAELIRAEQVTTGLALYRIGRYLMYARRLTKGEKNWSRWVEKDCDLSYPSACEAIRVAEHWGSEEAVAGKTVTELKRDAGIKVNDRRAKKERAERRASQEEVKEVIPKAPSLSDWGQVVKRVGGDLLDILDHEKEVNWEKVAADWIAIVETARKIDRNRAVDVYRFYATDRRSIEAFLDVESFTGTVAEPCCGNGVMVAALESRGYRVVASDLRDHEDVVGDRGVNLFSLKSAENVVTNPPYCNEVEIAKHLISITKKKVALLLKLQFYSSIVRQEFWEKHPPKFIYQLPVRPKFAIGGDLRKPLPTIQEHAWFLWERGFKGKTEILRLEF